MPKQAQLDFQRKDYLLLAVSGLLLLVWNVISWRFPFFWDGVSHSRIANWYLQTGFSQITIPDKLDAGHPPFFNLYLAAIWKIFGQTLPIAHLSMLPFLGLLLVQFNRLLRRWLAPNSRIWAMGMLFCEPTFLAQSSMVSADIALVAFYLLALNAILDRHRWTKALAMVLMASISFRGILMVVPLLLTDTANTYFEGKRRVDWVKLWPYVPVALLTMTWLWIHHGAVGWWISNPAGAYGEQRQVLGLTGMARNAALIGWRVADFGRIFLWAFVLIGALAKGWLRLALIRNMRQPILAFLIPLLVLSLLFIPFSNPPGHRYYLVCYLLLLIVAIGIAEMEAWRPQCKFGIILVALGMVTGHFWIYPKGVAQGWDGSLAHLPIFKLQREAETYFAANHISATEVCADFPLLHSPAETRLETRKSWQSTGSEGWYRNFLLESDCKWAIYANINNGYTEVQIADFDNSSKWELKQEFHSGQLFLRIYEHR